jgi:hypothetical protein
VFTDNIDLVKKYIDNLSLEAFSTEIKKQNIVEQLDEIRNILQFILKRRTFEDCVYFARHMFVGIFFIQIFLFGNSRFEKRFTEPIINKLTVFPIDAINEETVCT